MAREANRAAFQLLDLAAPHVLGKPLALFIAPADRPAFRSRLALAVVEPRKAPDPLLLRLNLAREAPDEVELRLHCLPASADKAVTVMCFLRPAS